MVIGAGVSVVAPVYNNASTLRELHRRILDALGRERVDLILVDDGSTDNSREVAVEIGATLIRRAHRGGTNAAVLTGLAAARQPFCCVLDADLEDPPEALPLMLARLNEHVRVVFSSRDEPQPATSRVFRFIVRTLFPTLPSMPCLCFAIDRETRERVVAMASEADYLPAVIGRLGVPTAQVNVTRGVRPGGGTGYSVWRRIRYGTGMTWSALVVKMRGPR